jgi:hypothetical protein
MGARRLWFSFGRAEPIDDASVSSKNGDGTAEAADDAPFESHSMLGALASRSGPLPDPPEPEGRSSLLALDGAAPPAPKDPADGPASNAPLHSTLAELAGLEEHVTGAFPIERAILISLFAHLAIVLFLMFGPDRGSTPQVNLLDALAAATATPKDDTPIPAFFSEAPGAPRPNPNRAPLSDADRRAGGGDPKRPKADLPYVPRQAGVEGLAPGPRAPRRPAQAGAAPKGQAARPAEAGEAGAVATKDPSAESRPSEFPANMRPQLGQPRETTKLAGLDSVIRDAARGTIRGGGGEDGSPLANEDGGFVDVGGVSFETKWYDWGPYMAEMLRRIKLHWKISRDLMILQQKGTVVIGFAIMADGTVADAKIVAPSDIPPYTHAAFQAIVTSDPFRPLPKDLLQMVPGKDRERIMISFVYYMSPEEFDEIRGKK